MFSGVLPQLTDVSHGRSYVSVPREPASLPEGVVEWLPGGVYGCWRDEFGIPAGVESDLPALAVDDSVVAFT
jgi:hypothetical protein